MKGGGRPRNYWKALAEGIAPPEPPKSTLLDRVIALVTFKFSPSGDKTIVTLAVPGRKWTERLWANKHLEPEEKRTYARKLADRFIAELRAGMVHEHRFKNAGVEFDDCRSPFRRG